MIINSVSYIAISYMLSQIIGISGLVYANCINMLIRSYTCIYFAVKHEYKERTKKEMKFIQGNTQTVLFYVRVLSGKIYLILTFLALGACIMLQKTIIPTVMRRIGIEILE